MKFDGHLLKQGVSVSGLNLISRITGFLRVAMVAAVLGKTYLANTYGTSNLVSNLLFELMAAGLLSTAVIPALIHRLEESRESALSLASALCSWAGAVMAAVAAMMILLSEPIMRVLTLAARSDAVRDQQISLGSFLIKVFALQLIAYGIGAVATAALQADRSFAVPAAAPIANNVLVIATMAWFARLVPVAERGLALDGSAKWILAVGTTLGVYAMASLPVIEAVRTHRLGRPRFLVRGMGLRNLGSKALAAGVASASLQVFLMVVLILANRVPGGVVAFQVAIAIFLLPYALIGNPLSTVVFPELVSAARQGADQLRARSRDAIGWLVLLASPAAAVLAATARPLARLTTYGAAAGDAGSVKISTLLVALSFGLVGYAVTQLLIRVAQASDHHARCAWVMGSTVLGASVLLVVTSRMVTGSASITILGFGYGLGLTVCAVLLALTLVSPGGDQLRRSIVSSALSACLAGIVASFVAGLGADESRLVDGLRLLISSTLAVIVYFLLLAGVRSILGLPAVRLGRFTIGRYGDAIESATGSPRLEESGVVAIVPAFNAASMVGTTVARLLESSAISTVVVVDDGSSDDTSSRARDSGARVLRLHSNSGKAAAVEAGVWACPNAEAFVFIDADLEGTASPQLIDSLLKPIRQDVADLVVAVPGSAGSKGGFGLIKGLARRGILSISGHDFVAPLSGQRALRGDLARGLRLDPRFGMEVGMTLDALSGGSRVLEVPFDFDHKHTGRSLAGFAHRARQGLNILMALARRGLSSRVVNAVLAGALVLAVSASVTFGPGRLQSHVRFSSGQKVVVFSFPYLSIEDLSAPDLPNLSGLTTEGSVANMSVRTVKSPPNEAEAWATFGAGGRVEVPRDAVPVAVKSSQGLSLVGFDALEGINKDLRVPVLPGELALGLQDANVEFSVVSAEFDQQGLVPSAFAVANRSGGVPRWAGAKPDDLIPTVIRELKTSSLVIADPGLISQAEAWIRPPLGGVASGVLTDAQGQSTSEVAPGSLEEARVKTDRLLGELISDLPAGVTLMVVSVVPPERSWSLTPVVLRQAEIEPGTLYSPSTRSNGLVTLTDLAPTVLGLIGAQVPEKMIGHQLESAPGRADLQTMHALDRDAVFRENTYFPIVLGYIVVQALFYVLAAVVLSVSRLSPRVMSWMRFLGISMAALPLATFVERGIPNLARFGLTGAVVAVVVLSLAIARLSLYWNSHFLAPLGAVGLMTTMVISVDVLLGGYLQMASLLGYSPHTAARFFGLGNTAFAVLGASALLWACVHILASRFPGAVFRAAAVLIFVIVVDGHPNLGADVGGILTLVPVFSLAIFALSGRKIARREVLIALGSVLALVVLATVLDYFRAADQRSHLGQLLHDVLSGNDSAFSTTVLRKLATNVRVFTRSIWTWTVPIISCFALYVLVLERRGKDLLPHGSPQRIFVVSSLALGLLGFALNDSGVVVTALVFVFVGPFLLFLAIRDRQTRALELE